MAACCEDSGANVGVAGWGVPVSAKGVICVCGTSDVAVAGGNPGSDEHAISREAMAQARTTATVNLIATFYQLTWVNLPLTKLRCPAGPALRPVCTSRTDFSVKVPDLVQIGGG